jgi:putative DNA primase/helicase
MGYQPVPCKGKAPFVKSWSDWCRTKMNHQELEMLVEQYGDSNIGLCMGEASGIIGVDVDTDDREINEIVKCNIPISPMARRGKKGFAAFYQYRGKQSYFKKIKDKGQVVLEVLGTGRFLVIPPSIHPDTNKPYVWADDVCDISDLPELTDKDISHLLRAVEKKCSANPGVLENFSGRNNALVSYMGKLIHSRGSTDDNVKKLLQFDKENHEKPLFSDPSENNCSDPLTNARRFYLSTELSILNNCIREGRPHDMPLSSDDGPREHFYKIGKNGQPVKPDYSKFVEYFVPKYEIRTVEKMMYRWDKTHFKGVFPDELNSFILKETCEVAQPEHLGRFHIIIRAKSFVDDERFRPKEGLLNLKNGILDLKNRELIPHSPELCFKHVIDLEYDSNCFAREFNVFLEDVMLADEELMETLQMYMGSVIMGGRPMIHKALCLVGGGSNGKSTFINIMRKLLGQGNISAVSMRNLDKPFSVVHMDGKLANLVEETPAQATVDAESFKTAVGGGKLQASYKGVDEFFMDVFCRFIFSCNDFPRFKDNSHGMNRRLLMVPFEMELEEEEYDYGLEGRIIENEMAGVLNWAISGYKMFVENGYKIPEPQAAKKLRHQYMLEADTILRWIDDCICYDPQEQIGWTATEFYNRYRTWCDIEQIPQTGKQRFIRKIGKYIKSVYKSHGASVKEALKLIDGKTRYKWLKIG